MTKTCEYLNHGRTVVVRGIAYDFPNTPLAEAFVRAMESGAAPPQTAELLLDRERLPRSADH